MFNSLESSGDSKTIGEIFSIGGNLSVFYWLCELAQVKELADSVRFADLLIFASIKFKERHDEGKAMERAQRKNNAPKMM